MTSRPMENEALRRAYQELVARQDNAANVVTPEELLQVVEHTGSQETRLALLNRIAGNTDAQRDLALLRAAQSLAPRASQSLARMITAIAAVLLLSVGVWRWQTARLAPPVERGANNSFALVSPSAASRIDSNTTFAWRSVAGATQYEIELVDDQGARVWSNVTRDTVLTIPASVSISNASLWFVSATTVGGTVRSAAREIQRPGK